jgi:hypothetical protein
MTVLNADKARIFRITHIDNVPWILDNGLHCCKSKVQDPNFRPIGKQELIDKRRNLLVEMSPGGTLGDYVPFYFTPSSIMLYYIKTGYGGVIQRANADIAILVSSIPRLVELRLKFLFTNAAAYFHEAKYFHRVRDLDQIDWHLLQSRIFSKDPEDPGKQGRYHAEALIHRHLPLEALLGIACFDSASKAKVDREVSRRDLTLSVRSLPQWYF